MILIVINLVNDCLCSQESKYLLNDIHPLLFPSLRLNGRYSVEEYSHLVSKTYQQIELIICDMIFADKTQHCFSKSGKA